MPGVDIKQLEPTRFFFKQKKTPFVFRERDLRDHRAVKKASGRESANESFSLSV